MNDTYSLERDDKSDSYNKEINNILNEFYGKSIVIKDNHGNTDDFRGIDKTVCHLSGEVEYKWQVKTIEYAGFNTVTIPEVDYEKYKGIKDLYIIHSYYIEGKGKIKQYVIFKFQDILPFDSKKKRRKRGKGKNSKVSDTDNGTDFYYWNYSLIDKIFLMKDIPNKYISVESLGYSFIDDEL
jgi:hypothetical protein